MRSSTGRQDAFSPSEGLYWAVAQYQIAHLELKQELRAIAAGEPADVELLRVRAAVLASKASVLTEPSEVRAALSAVPGFEEASGQIAALQRRIGPVLGGPDVGQPQARQVLDVFEELLDDRRLSEFASSMRLAEVAAQQQLVTGLNRRMTLAVLGFGLCWVMLSVWLLQLAQSRRRYATAARERTQAVQAMEQAIGGKRKFLSMVSHELRSPLQSIVTAVEAIAHDMGVQGSQPQSVAAIRRIRHAVSVMQGQFRDLLTIAKSDSSPFSLQLETFDFGELVRDVCADLEDSATIKGLALEVSVPDNSPTVSADPVRVAQVLRNLLENAIRYSEAGQVSVQLLPVETAASDSVWMRFTVVDSGPGLPPAALQRLEAAAVPFEPHVDGTGIGIFVIRDVLQQLGGHLVVQTSSTTGTTIEVSIPVNLAQGRQARDAAGADGLTSTALGKGVGTALLEELDPPDRATAGDDSLNVLVVDDRDEVLLALTGLASRLGHRADAAPSAARAREFLMASRYDAVLIDLEMPVEDGLSLATFIRNSSGPSNQSMLILISAAENQAIGLQRPFDGFLQKPIDERALVGLIGSRTPR